MLHYFTQKELGALIRFTTINETKLKCQPPTPVAVAQLHFRKEFLKYQ